MLITDPGFIFILLGWGGLNALELSDHPSAASRRRMSSSGTTS